MGLQGAGEDSGGSWSLHLPKYKSHLHPTFPPKQMNTQTT